jgi:hypothetical protein
MFEEFATASASSSSELAASSSALPLIEASSSGSLQATLDEFLLLHPNIALILSFCLLLWLLACKGFALWRAAKANHQIWFVIILVLNTFGILELIYIFYLSKQNWTDKKQKFLSFFGVKTKTTDPTDHDQN